MALLAGGGGGGKSGSTTGGGCVLSMAPMMKNSVPIPNAEMAKESFRPRDSTKKNTNIAVAMTLTIP